jgi:peptidoglycan/xylan/chitin deacetylase (PgdA/CDA1 family)
MSDTPITWPNDARIAVMLTFDFDAESVWLARDPENAGRIGVLSQGLYGAKRAVPKLLQLLRQENLPATFFIPGWVAENHTDRCKEILDAGHEVGHHGYSHQWADARSPDKECEDFDRGSEALDRYLNCKPRGYRPPGAEITQNTLKMLTDRKFLYNSNMQDDVYPYRHHLPDGRKGPLELPTHWSIGDANYVWHSIRHPRVIQTNDHIFSVWKEEFDELYQWGGLFNLVLHPQAIGRPSRIALLRRFISYVRTFDGVWWANGTDVAEAFTTLELG